MQLNWETKHMDQVITLHTKWILQEEKLFNKKAFLILTMTQNQLTRFFTWITCLSRGTFILDEISLGLDEQTIISNSPEEWDVTIIIGKQFIN